MKIASAILGAAAVAGLLLSAAEAQAGVNLLQNGDFETVGPIVGGLPSPGAPWAVGPGADISDLTGADYIPCCGTFGTPAELANHFASFGAGNVNNVSALTQAFSTVGGGSFALAFDAGALGAGTQDIVASVYAVGNSTPIATRTILTTANDNLGSTFNPYALDFTAMAGGSYYVSFNAVGQGDNIDPILDNVSVSAVPEPATWAMMLLGFAALGFAGYRQARKSVTPVAA